LFIGTTRPRTILPVNTSAPIIPAARAAPQTFGEFGMHRHRDGGVAAAFLGRDLHRHLAIKPKLERELSTSLGTNV
jgi:hypothetical protein